MARTEFIDNLRQASRLLAPPRVSSGSGSEKDFRLSRMLDSADLWLTRRAVDGFDPADFSDWPKRDQETLAAAVTAFRKIAEQVPANRPATRTQSEAARQQLETAIGIVRKHLLPEWLQAQKRLLSEARTAAESRDWFVHEDVKKVIEGLLGAYEAPRLYIRTQDKEVVLDPVAYFGSGRQGVVDLLVMPTYERTHLFVFKDGAWQIMSQRGHGHSRPFSQATFVNTISRLP